MGLTRMPFQGVLNIIRFNWHFYVVGLVVVSLLILIAGYFENALQPISYAACVAASVAVVTSLLVSCYVYDLSGLYDLNWIESSGKEELVVNVNAGFDETSVLLKEKYRSAKLVVLDFYDPNRHTEVSIERACKAYPAYPGTIKIDTAHLPLADDSADAIVVIFSAHEIRNEQERIAFFRELTRAVKPAGKIYVTEHLRDVPNFLAYTFGFVHFYSLSAWLGVFRDAGLEVKQKLKHTPFVSVFILGRNGGTS